MGTEIKLKFKNELNQKQLCDLLSEVDAQCSEGTDGKGYGAYEVVTESEGLERLDRLRGMIEKAKLMLDFMEDISDAEEDVPSDTLRCMEEVVSNLDTLTGYSDAHEGDK